MMKYAVQLVLFALAAAVTAACLVGGTYTRLLRGAARQTAAPVQLTALPPHPVLPVQAALPLPAARALPVKPGNDRRAAAALLIRLARCAGLGARMAASRSGRQGASPGRGPPRLAVPPKL